LLPSGLIHKPQGAIPEIIVAETVFVAVFITLTVPVEEFLFETYTFNPSGLTEIPKGPEPTVIVAETVFVEVFITLTEAAL